MGLVRFPIRTSDVFHLFGLQRPAPADGWPADTGEGEEMSLRWTEEQLAEQLAKPWHSRGRSFSQQSRQQNSCVDTSRPEDAPEWKLQAKIEGYCRERGLYFFHDRSRRFNAPGHPDLVIALPGGRVLWLELKSRHGRMTKEQKMVRLMLLALGQEFFEVRSFRGFLLALAEPRPTHPGSGVPGCSASAPADPLRPEGGT
jgi:hypothetical protein